MAEQRTDEWHQQRLGKVTASRIADVIAKTKSGPAASRKNYLAELVAERLTGQPTNGYVNAAMQHGIDTEPQARAAYAFYGDKEVAECGFVDHPVLPMTGASPDGLVGDDGLVEIKCPTTATHLDFLFSHKIPDKYAVQMLWQMECTGRAWCDFATFDPRMPANLQLWVKRVERDDTRLGELRQSVSDFLREVDDTIRKLGEAA